MNVNDLIGMRCGRLTVISYSHKEKKTKGNGFKHYYNCKCDCGNDTIKERSALRFKGTNSCGCILKEIVVNRNISNTKYKEKDIYKGMFHSWIAMKSRCNNENDKSYKWYGAKGIKVCDEWLDWENFKQWSLANGWKDGLTIDRIDGKQGYRPNNCRWVDMNIQNNNKDNLKFLTYQGRTQNLSQWCKELDLPYGRTKARLNKCGMTVEQAFTLGRYKKQESN